LGIEFITRADGSILLTQVGLITRIIDAMGLQNANPKDTPATETLGSYKEAPRFSGDYNYRSVIGMCLYLTGTTRIDCAFAIHQCARFSHDPREPHHKALKRLVCYLKKTHYQGLIINPPKSKEPSVLNLWVDADFAGLWGKEDPEDPACVRSRTGFLLTLGDTPVIWSSKLQTEIATSTMEAEYIALSTGMKTLLFLRAIHEEICVGFKLPFNPKSNISTVWEDNSACKILATTDPPRLTPRSKSIAVKYHWFREHLKQGEIEVKAIETKLQRANILTKPIAKTQFEEERLAVMGF
jgi:hypothetical protein